MPSKPVAWTLVAALAFTLVLLLNYWAAYQPLSTLVYSGIVLALCGLANLFAPFRFLGVRKRAVGALILVGGASLTLAALFWPAPMIRVVQASTRLDDIIPEYQFFERHSTRVHARPEQVLQSVRQSTFRDMKSLATLMKIRSAALHIDETTGGPDSFQDMRVLDAFSATGFLLAGSDHEIVMFGIGAMRRPEVHTAQEFADYRGQGAVKMAFDFNVEDTGAGWSTLTTETRVLALDDLTSRRMGTYWRLIVPGSGLLRRQWLDSIKTRAESMPNGHS